MATPKNNSVLRAFAILRAFDEHSPEMTANEIATKTELNGATAHRFLLTLEDLGAVVRAPQGRSNSAWRWPTSAGGTRSTR